MKLEVEVTEDEMRDAIQRHIRTAVADRVNGWGMQEKVKKMVNEAWDETANNLIRESLANHQTLKDQIHTEIVRKIKRNLDAAMKDMK